METPNKRCEIKSRTPMFFCVAGPVRQRKKTSCAAHPPHHPLHRPIAGFTLEGKLAIQYGRKCHKCSCYTDVVFWGQPLYRTPHPTDVPHGTPANQQFFFHSTCWQDYQRIKANARRRERYREVQRHQQQQLPQLMPPPLLAICDAPAGQPALLNDECMQIDSDSDSSSR